MEKIVEQGLLYDFYGELLTDHQKQVYEAAPFERTIAGFSWNHCRMECWFYELRRYRVCRPGT